VDFLQKLEQEKQLITQGHNEQLKKINTLFDPTAKDYETIDFDGLYSLLQQIAERERERERTKVNDEEEIKPIYSGSRKKKP